MRRFKLEHEKYIDKDQFKALVDAGKRHSYPRAAHLFMAAGLLGLRLGEAITLNRGCFKRLAQGFVEIETLKRKDKHRPVVKNGSVVGYLHPILPVAIGPIARSFFSRMISKTPADQFFMFPGRNRGHISATHAQRVFHDCAKASGLGKGYSFHSLRHHKGVMTWEKSGDYQEVKDEMRHASAKTTEIYVHMSTKDRLERAKQVDSEYNDIVV